MLVNELAGVVDLVVDHDENVLSCVVFGHILICVLLFGHFCGLRVLLLTRASFRSEVPQEKQEIREKNRKQSQQREARGFPRWRTANNHLLGYENVSMQLS